MALTFGWWKLDDLTDSSGNGLDLTLYGTAAVPNPDGKIDGCYTFKQASVSYLRTGTTPYIDPSGNSTISAWIYPTSWHATSSNGVAGLMMYTSNKNYSIILDQGRASIHYGYGGARLKVLGTSALALNNWWHVCVTYNNTTKTFTIYLNGEKHVESTVSGVDFQNYRFAIGSRSAEYTADYYFNGHIDDVRYYKEALSQAEITQIFNEGSGVIVPTHSIYFATDLHYTSKEDELGTESYYSRTPGLFNTFVKVVNQNNPKMVILLGDIGAPPFIYDRFRTAWRDVIPPKALLAGNHDLKAGYTQLTVELEVDGLPENGGSKFNQTYPIPGTNIRVITIDGQFANDIHSEVHPGVSFHSASLPWLDNLLRTSPETVFLLCTHIIPMHPYEFDPTSAAQVKAVVDGAIAARPGIKVTWFAGHDHPYEITTYTTWPNQTGHVFPTIVRNVNGRYIQAAIGEDGNIALTTAVITQLTQDIYTDSTVSTVATTASTGLSSYVNLSSSASQTTASGTVRLRAYSNMTITGATHATSASGSSTIKAGLALQDTTSTAANVNLNIKVMKDYNAVSITSTAIAGVLSARALLAMADITQTSALLDIKGRFALKISAETLSTVNVDMQTSLNVELLGKSDTITNAPGTLKLRLGASVKSTTLTDSITALKSYKLFYSSSITNTQGLAYMIVGNPNIIAELSRDGVLRLTGQIIPSEDNYLDKFGNLYTNGKLIFKEIREKAF